MKLVRLITVIVAASFISRVAIAQNLDLRVSANGAFLSGQGFAAATISTRVTPLLGVYLEAGRWWVKNEPAILGGDRRVVSTSAAAGLELVIPSRRGGWYAVGSAGAVLLRYRGSDNEGRDRTGTYEPVRPAFTLGFGAPPIHGIIVEARFGVVQPATATGVHYISTLGLRRLLR